MWELEKIGNSDLLSQALKKNRKRKVKIEFPPLLLISVSHVAGPDEKSQFSILKRRLERSTEWIIAG